MSLASCDRNFVSSRKRKDAIDHRFFISAYNRYAGDFDAKHCRENSTINYISFKKSNYDFVKFLYDNFLNLVHIFVPTVMNRGTLYLYVFRGLV